MNERGEVLKVRALDARYGQKQILNGVDLSVNAGEARVILGGSGSGKSTLLKHVIGLLRPYGGEIEVLGRRLDLADESDRDAILARIGMVFQGGALLNSLTTVDNVALPLKEQTDLPDRIIREVALMKLDLVGLADAAFLTPPELSGGMKKRAAVARAMALDPEILFCDEPSAGLDPKTAAELDELLLHLRETFGMSLVVVTHELQSIQTIAERVLMLHAGKVIVDAAFEEAQQSAHPVARAFFDRTLSERGSVREKLDTILGQEGTAWS